MSLRVLGSPQEVAAKLRTAIEAALPGARVTVTPGAPGHFELAVTWQGFAGKTLVQQQQLVYGAIAPLLAGDAPPVHAIDRLQTRAS